MLLNIVTILLTIVFLKSSFAQDVLDGMEREQNSLREPKAYDIDSTSQWNPLSLRTMLMTTHGEQGDDIADMSVLENRDIRTLSKFADGIHALLCMRIRQLNYHTHPNCRTFDETKPRIQPRLESTVPIVSPIDDSFPFQLISKKGRIEDSMKKRSHSRLSISGPLNVLANMLKTEVKSKQNAGKNEDMRYRIIGLGRK